MKDAKKYQCPWCAEYVEPRSNDGTGEPSFGGTKEAWLLRNPLQCPECEGVGGFEDFGVIEVKAEELRP